MTEAVNGRVDGGRALDNRDADRLSRLTDGIAVEDARALIDCEISIGRIESSGWIIARSTLPFREGQQLTITTPVNRDRMRTTDIAANGDVTVRDWDIHEAEGDLQAILAVSA